MIMTDQNDSLSVEDILKTMPLSEFTKKLIETKLTKYCNQKIPIHARDQIKLIYKIIGNKVTVFETRPYSMNPSVWTETPLAQFRFDHETKKWVLYWMDRNSRWHLYDLVKPSADFEDMLKELDRDPTGTFWG
jgi:ribosomal protein S17